MDNNKQSWFSRYIGSKFGKLIYLSKKAIYFAWYRHHFLIPPRVLLKYIRSFFVNLRRSNTTSNLYINQVAYIKWFEASREKIEYVKFKSVFLKICFLTVPLPTPLGPDKTINNPFFINFNPQFIYILLIK